MNLQQIAHDVSKYLPGYVVQEEKCVTVLIENRAVSLIRTENGIKYQLLLIHQPDNRIRVSADWPTSKYYHTDRYPKEKPEAITVSAARTPQQIAQDIQRRYLSKMEEATKEGVKQRDEADQYTENKRALTVKLARIIDQKPSINSDVLFSGYWSKNQYVEARVESPSSVTFMRLTMTAEQAEKVLEFLKSLN